VRDLFFHAKHLFVAAMVAGCGVTWLNEGGANRPQGARSAGYFRARREPLDLAGRQPASEGLLSAVGRAEDTDRCQSEGMRDIIATKNGHRRRS
jgi:hypothetical protein